MKKQVIATAMGFIDGARRRPGDVFDVDVKASASWFKDAGAETTKQLVVARKRSEKPEAVATGEVERNVI